MEDWCVTSDSWLGGPWARRPAAAHSGFERVVGGSGKGRGRKRIRERRDKENHVNNSFPPPPLSVISDKNILTPWIWGYSQQVARPIPTQKAAAGSEKGWQEEGASGGNLRRAINLHPETHPTPLPPLTKETMTLRVTHLEHSLKQWC